MNLDLNEEQRLIKETAREFLGEEFPLALVRELRDDETGYPDGFWQKMSEMGWLGVGIPEEYGGSDTGFVELALIMEAMGEFCTTGPFFSTVVLGAQALLLDGSKAQKESLLPKIIAGELVIAFAQTEPGNWYGCSNITTRAIKDGNDYILSGTKVFVDNAHVADCIFCVAQTDAGLSLFMVDRNIPGLSLTPMNTVAYEKQSEVVFDKVKVPAENIIGEVGQAVSLLEAIEQRAAVAKSAEMVGAIQKVLDMTVEYAKERVQFGHPIGSFQAVQHHCAKMLVDVDSSRMLTYRSAYKTGAGESASADAAMTKGWVSDVATEVTRLGHQIHGAISYTDEHDLHLYYRKVKAASMAFGDSDYHQEKFVQSLGL